MKKKNLVVILSGILFLNLISIAWGNNSKRAIKEEKFDEKVKMLKSKNISERIKASYELILLDKKKGGKKVIDFLEIEKSIEVKKSMINALANSGNNEAINLIKRYLKSEDNNIRLESASALVKLGDDEGVEELKKVAIDKQEKRGRRSLAIRSLGSMKSDQVVMILEDILDDKDFAIRLQSVNSLGKIATEKAFKLIRKMKKDKDERVKNLAKNLLKRQKN